MSKDFPTWTQLEQKLDKLRRNRSKIPLKDQMGKYKAGFDKLEIEIQQMAWPLAIGYIVGPMRWHPEWNIPGSDAEKRYDKVQAKMKARIHGWKEDGTASNIIRDLTYSMNLDRFLNDCINKLYPGLWWEDYASYWTSYSYETDEGWMNECLPGMAYDSATEMWWKLGGLDKLDDPKIKIHDSTNSNFYLGLPPTMDEVRKVVKRCADWERTDTG